MHVVQIERIAQMQARCSAYITCKYLETACSDTDQLMRAWYLTRRELSWELGLPEPSHQGQAIAMQAQISQDSHNQKMVLWMGNLVSTATREAIQTILGQYGGVMTSPLLPFLTRGVCCVSISFCDTRHADVAISELNNRVHPSLSGQMRLLVAYKFEDVVQVRCVFHGSPRESW